MASTTTNSCSTAATAVRMDSLNENHVFRLVFRLLEDHSLIDWSAVLQRLQSHPLEVQTWVQTNYCSRRLFLHELCEVDFPQQEMLHGGNDRRRTANPFTKKYIQVLEITLQLYPAALQEMDGHEYWPLHILCRQVKFLEHGMTSPRVWSETATAAFHKVLRACPAMARCIVAKNQKTAVHSLLDCLPTTRLSNVQHLNCCLELLDHFPQALQRADSMGNYPLHVASSKCNLETMRLLTKKWPHAAALRGGPRQQTPLLSLIRSMGGSTSFELTKFLIQSCPQSVSIGDHDDRDDTMDMADGGRMVAPEENADADADAAVLPGTVMHHRKLQMTNLTRDLEPCGDALDYLICKYCELVNVPFTKFAVPNERHPQEDGDDDVSTASLTSWRRPQPDQNPIHALDYPGYIRSNLYFLQQQRQKASHAATNDSAQDDSGSRNPSRRPSDSNRRLLRAKHLRETFDLIVLTLRTMYGQRPDFLPLHALCSGRQCRPWHLVILDEFLNKFGTGVPAAIGADNNHCRNVRDVHGNLPLHLFLESCMLEKHRALQQLYARHEAEYMQAVCLCLDMLLDDDDPNTRQDDLDQKDDYNNGEDDEEEEEEDLEPREARMLLQPNGEGRLPIHLALESTRQECVILHLLRRKGASATLLMADPKTGLLPFCAAAVGAMANVNLAFLLLQQEPRAAWTHLQPPA